MTRVAKHITWGARIRFHYERRRRQPTMKILLLCSILFYRARKRRIRDIIIILLLFMKHDLINIKPANSGVLVCVYNRYAFKYNMRTQKSKRYEAMDNNYNIRGEK